jgi:hypothetical protein
VITVCVAIFVKTFAIFVACFLVTIAFWGLCRRRRRAQQLAEQQERNTSSTSRWCWQRRKQEASMITSSTSQTGRFVLTNPGGLDASNGKTISPSNVEKPPSAWSSRSSKPSAIVEGRNSDYASMSLASLGSSQPVEAPSSRPKRFWQRKEKSTSATSISKNDYHAIA